MDTQKQIKLWKQQIEAATAELETRTRHLEKWMWLYRLIYLFWLPCWLLWRFVSWPFKYKARREARRRIEESQRIVLQAAEEIKASMIHTATMARQLLESLPEYVPSEKES